MLRGCQITLRHEMANRSLTYVDWSRGGWHPATFGFWEATEEWLRALKVSPTSARAAAAQKEEQHIPNQIIPQFLATRVEGRYLQA